MSYRLYVLCLAALLSGCEKSHGSEKVSQWLEYDGQCPSYSQSIGIREWFDNLPYDVCNRDKELILTLRDTLGEDLSQNSIGIISGTLINSPRVLAAEAFVKTRVGDEKLWKFYSKTKYDVVRSYFCYKKIDIQNLSPFWCLQKHRDTIQIARDLGIGQYREYIKGNTFNLDTSLEVERIFDRAEDLALIGCLRTTKGCPTK